MEPDLEAVAAAYERVAAAHRAYAKRLRKTGEFPGDLRAVRAAERQLAMVRTEVARDPGNGPKIDRV